MRVGSPAAAHYSYATLLNRLRAEIEKPLSLRYVRLQVKPRHWWAEFWCDRRYIGLKVLLLAALVFLAAVI